MANEYTAQGAQGATPGIHPPGQQSIFDVFDTHHRVLCYLLQHFRLIASWQFNRPPE